MLPTFENLLNEHGRTLSRVAATYEASESIQQELYQEICVAVWQGLQRFKGDSSLRTYILRIAHNRGVTHVSKESKIFKAKADDDASSEAIDRSSIAKSAEKHLMQSQQLNLLLDAIRALKLPARQIITLSMEGLSYQEIATVTGLSVNNVGITINRVKKTLKRRLEHE